MIRKRRQENSTALHETNFAKLSMVVPGLRKIRRPQCLRGHGNSLLELEILEKSRYTTTFSLLLRQGGKQHWLPTLHMKVRTYHDAKVAEVLALQHHHRLQPRYPYPNPRMYHSDEKQQINRFFGEWLDHCLRNNCLFHDEVAPLDV
jgi:uncharacterized protein YqiB (DUF1249 family)